jgi:hypothetical protein
VITIFWVAIGVVFGPNKNKTHGCIFHVFLFSFHVLTMSFFIAHCDFSCFPFLEVIFLKFYQANILCFHWISPFTNWNKRILWYCQHWLLFCKPFIHVKSTFAKVILKDFELQLINILEFVLHLWWQDCYFQYTFTM